MRFCRGGARRVKRIVRWTIRSQSGKQFIIATRTPPSRKKQGWLPAMQKQKNQPCLNYPLNLKVFCLLFSKKYGKKEGTLFIKNYKKKNTIESALVFAHCSKNSYLQPRKTNTSARYFHCFPRLSGSYVEVQ